MDEQRQRIRVSGKKQLLVALECARPNEMTGYLETEITVVRKDGETKLVIGACPSMTKKRLPIDKVIAKVRRTPAAAWK